MSRTVMCFILAAKGSGTVSMGSFWFLEWLVVGSICQQTEKEPYVLASPKQ